MRRAHPRETEPSYGADPGLPGASVLADPRALARWLGDRDLASRRVHDIEVRVLKYRPGRRLAARLRPQGSSGRWMVKIYRPARARQVERSYRLLEAGLTAIEDLRLPQLLAADSDLGILLWEHLGGRPVFWERSRTSPDPPEEGPRAVGRVLARIHGARVPLGRIWTGPDEARLLLDLAASGPPGAARLARDLAPLLRRKRGAHWPIHRDFYAQQVLATGRPPAPLRIGVLDWDDAARGPADLDVGNFLAHLTLVGLRAPRHWRSIGIVRRAFLLGYSETAEAREEAWGLWESATLLRLSALAWNRHRGEDGVWRAPAFRPPRRPAPAEEARALLEWAAEQLPRSL